MRNGTELGENPFYSNLPLNLLSIRICLGGVAERAHHEKNKRISPDRQFYRFGLHLQCGSVDS